MLHRLLLAPLAPVRGVVWVAERLTDVAERQLVEEETAAIRTELAELADAHARGRLDDTAYDEREDELMHRLLTLRAARVSPAEET